MGVPVGGASDRVAGHQAAACTNELRNLKLCTFNSNSQNCTPN